MENKLKSKEKLCQFIIQEKENEIILIDDPIFQLISNLEDIKKIEDNKYFTKYLYINKNNIHEMLYDLDEFINIKDDKQNQNLTFYFYLSLLIMSFIEVISYKYPFNYIEEMYTLLKNEKSEKLKPIIISKLILEFIDNYEGFEEDENNEKEIDIIKKICQENLNNNLNWKDLDLSKIDILNNNIDDIYIQIIIRLFENNNFENDDIIDILNELSIETIDITKNMFDKLSEFLNTNENIKKYKIKNEDDLLKFEIINFYFILFKFILKHSYYIYNNYFLSKIRKTIISFIKSNPILKITDIKKEKLKYILIVFLDSDYYYINYIKHINESNKNILSENDSFDLNTTPSCNSIYFSNPSSGRYSDYINKDNKNDLLLFKEDENENCEILENTSFDIEIIKYENKFIYKCNKINYGLNKNKTITYEEFKKNKDNNNSIYFIKNLLKKLKNNFKKELNNNENFKISIEIEFNNKEFNKSSCTYILINPKDGEKNVFKDNDLLSSDVGEGFYFLIYEIKEINKEIKNYIDNDLLIFKIIEQKYDYISDSDDYDDNKYSLIKLVKIIRNPDESEVEFIKELSNGFYISGSNIHKLIVYNKLFNPILQIKELDDLKYFNFIINNICEICEVNPNQKKENEIHLFVLEHI